MPNFSLKLAKIAVPVLALGGLYLLALHKHALREEIRQAAVTLTPGCTEKLARYALAAGAEYVSPYVLQHTGNRIKRQGYSKEDIRAIQRGCNIIDDTQGQLAEDRYRERWTATRYIRGSHVSSDHCHQGHGDKQHAHSKRSDGPDSLTDTSAQT